MTIRNYQPATEAEIEARLAPFHEMVTKLMAEAEERRLHREASGYWENRRRQKLTSDEVDDNLNAIENGDREIY